MHNICKACTVHQLKVCEGDMCVPFQNAKRQEELLAVDLPTNYNGLRFTSDAMDCALPIAIDSHGGCSYSCLYCFANNLQRNPERNMIKIQKMKEEGTFYSEFSIYQLEKFLNREKNSYSSKNFYDLLDAHMPVQLGALGDPCDHLEEHTKWLLKAIPLFIEHKIPVRVGTKGAQVMMKKEYRDAFHQNPKQFWFSISLITPSDELLAKIDINAPSATERLKAMKEYSKSGHNMTLRMRPFLPGISDAYPGEPEAWRVLLEKAADAGARAVSFEWIFLQSALTPRQKVMYYEMFKAMGNSKFGNWWNSNSNTKESCRRASREIKYELTMKIREKTHELGMIFGCSDPHFKELNDYGCCCGIPDDDEWFGGWSRRQLINVIVEMKRAYDRGENLQVNYLDWKPEWAHKIDANVMIAFGDAHSHRVRRNLTFGDTMRSKWNNPNHPRSPFIYFAGVMRPIGIDLNSNDLVYEYRDWNKDFDKNALELNYKK